jgi:hypothetical protein
MFAIRATPSHFQYPPRIHVTSHGTAYLYYPVHNAAIIGHGKAEYVAHARLVVAMISRYKRLRLTALARDNH